MRTIKVDVDHLKEVLVKNRAAHKVQFEQAWEGYRKVAAKELEDRLDAVKDGKPFQLWFNLSVPEDHTDDYDQTLEMLELHVEDTIALSINEYQQYFKDDWGWKGKFASDNATYSSIDL